MEAVHIDQFIPFNAAEPGALKTVLPGGFKGKIPGQEAIQESGPAVTVLNEGALGVPFPAAGEGIQVIPPPGEIIKLKNRGPFGFDITVDVLILKEVLPGAVKVKIKGRKRGNKVPFFPGYPFRPQKGPIGGFPDCGTMDTPVSGMAKDVITLGFPELPLGGQFAGLVPPELVDQGLDKDHRGIKAVGFGIFDEEAPGLAEGGSPFAGPVHGPGDKFPFRRAGKIELGETPVIPSAPAAGSFVDISEGKVLFPPGRGFKKPPGAGTFHCQSGPGEGGLFKGFKKVVEGFFGALIRAGIYPFRKDRYDLFFFGGGGRYFQWKKISPFGEGGWSIRENAFQQFI
jgi:hypothetical protein